MMKDVTMELAQILMVKVCHQGVVIFSKIPPLTLLPLAQARRLGSKRAKERNRAGYTATSCGCVGRGRNACFLTFRLVSTDEPTGRPTDGQSPL